VAATLDGRRHLQSKSKPATTLVGVFETLGEGVAPDMRKIPTGQRAPRLSHPTGYQDVSRPAVAPNQKCNRSSFRMIRSDTFSCGSDRLRTEIYVALQPCCPGYTGLPFTSVSARRFGEIDANSSHEIAVVLNYLQLAAVFTRWSLLRIDEIGGPRTIYYL
jgi:hypothetical protein